MTRGRWRTLPPSLAVLVALVIVVAVPVVPAAANPPAGTWRTVDPTLVPRANFTATVLHDGRVLVAGGALGDPTATAELYDPTTHGWTATGSLRTARSDHTATLLADGRVLVTGGRGRQGAIATAEMYDPAAGTWAETGAMAEGRYLHSASLLADGTVLVAGGRAGNDLVLRSAEIFDPVAGTWRAAPSLAAGHAAQTATILNDGRVLVVGGIGPDDQATADTEVYTATAGGTWAAAGLLAGARMGHTATRLPDGRVLIAGGAARDGSALKSVELYDPAAGGHWSAGPDLTAARNGAIAALLTGTPCQTTTPPDWCGRLVVAAGFDRSAAPDYSLSSTEVFDPQSVTWKEAGPVAGPQGAGLRAAPLGDGTVLAIGVGSSAVFDPGSTAQPPSIRLLSRQVESIRGGGTVRIAGYGLSGATAVHFGETPAVSFEPDPTNPDTGLRAVAPAHAAGQVDITVTTPAGTSYALALTRLTFVPSGWSATGAMANTRTAHTASLLGGVPCESASPPAWCGKVLVAGGFVREREGTQGDQFDPQPSAEVYDPVTGAWSNTGSMAAGRANHTATVLRNGKVLVTGGLTSNTGQPVASADVYDPATGVWSPVAPMHDARDRQTATLLADGRVLVVGGRGSPGSAEVYDPIQDVWTAVEGAMATPRANHAATLLPSGKVLVTGGSDPTPPGTAAVASTELYDPGNNHWQAGPAMAASRELHTAVLLKNGKVLVAGGTTDRTTELYDPAGGNGAGSWTNTAAGLRYARSRHSATVLLDGSVLVAGGAAPLSGPASTELYDPASDSWTLASPLDDCGDRLSCAGRISHTATLLGNGQVLATGGKGFAGFNPFDPGIILDTAELFEVMATTTPKPAVGALNPAVGPTAGGTEVTITGSNFFSPSTAVRIGGQPAEILHLASDEVIVRTPTGGQGLAPVVVTTPAGDSPMSVRGRFTYASGAFAATSGLDRCTPVASSCTTRWDATATRLDGPACRTQPAAAWCGQVLVAGGFASTPNPRPVHDTSISSTQLYDAASGTWRPGPPLDSCNESSPSWPVCPDWVQHTATLLDPSFCRDAPPAYYPCGNVLVAGGTPQDRTDQSGNNNSLFNPLPAVLYDPTTSAVRATGSMLVERYLRVPFAIEGGLVSALLDGVPCQGTSHPSWCGQVLAFGNLSGVNGPQLYDPVAGTWSAPAGAPKSPVRARVTLTTLPDGKVLLVGGEAPPEVYDPGTGTWSTTAPMISNRTSHAAVTLAGGRVLVAGGFASSSTGASAELYDPATRSWVGTGAMRVARADFTLTRLADGKVLAVGGIDPVSGQAIASAEVYDPSAAGGDGAWTLTMPLADARTHHRTVLLDSPACRAAAATPLPYCDRVLVEGGGSGGYAGQLQADNGYSYQNNFVGSAELYTMAPTVTGIDPTTGPSKGGTAVTVHGFGMAGATSVAFGEKPATSFHIDSTTQITAGAPPQPGGPVDVVVTNPGGWSLVQPAEADPSRFTYAASQAPGAVSDLAVAAVSSSQLRLTFSAAPSDGEFPPPATRYVVKQSTAPINSAGDFDAANSLCGGVCSFSPAKVGDTLTLNVSGLRPGTTYYYAVRAENGAGDAGPLSNVASGATLAAPTQETTTTTAPTTTTTTVAKQQQGGTEAGGTTADTGTGQHSVVDDASGAPVETAASGEQDQAGTGTAGSATGTGGGGTGGAGAGGGSGGAGNAGGSGNGGAGAAVTGGAGPQAASSTTVAVPGAGTGTIIAGPTTTAVEAPPDSVAQPSPARAHRLPGWLVAFVGLFGAVGLVLVGVQLNHRVRGWPGPRPPRPKDPEQTSSSSVSVR